MNETQIEQHIRHIYTYMAKEIENPNVAMSIQESVIAIALVSATKNKRDALSSAYRFSRNIERGIKKIYSEGNPKEYLKLVK